MWQEQDYSSSLVLVQEDVMNLSGVCLLCCSTHLFSLFFLCVGLLRLGMSNLGDKQIREMRANFGISPIQRMLLSLSLSLILLIWAVISKYSKRKMEEV